MKKFKSFLALLLLGGLVATGCGKDKTPSNSGGSQQNSGGSQSGDSGSGGGNQGGEGGNQQGGNGGQQGGEGGGGGQQQGHEVTGESRWANKKFVLDHIEAEDEQVAQAMQAEYTNGYAALFDDGVVEFVSVQQQYTYAYLGTFRVADDDSYAIVTLTKDYDGESEGYYWISGGGFTTNIRQNAQTGLYVMPMQMQNHGMTISFDVHMTLSNEYPQKANIPTDPNGDSYNPQYQIYKASYDNLIINRGILYNYPNYTVTHTFTQNIGLGPQEVTETFKAENYKFSVQHSSTPTQELIYERTTENLNNNNAHIYTCYGVQISENGERSLYSTTPNVELYYDNWDDDIGLIEIPFNSLRYDSETHAYYAAHYVCDANHPDTSAVSAIRFYFNNGRLIQVTFKDYTQTQFEYNFSNYNQTTIDIPEGGGGGVNPQPAQWPSANVQTYLVKIGVTQDTLPAAQNANITGYSLYPDSLEYVTDSFTVQCFGGQSYAESYGTLLVNQGFSYDGGTGYYTSPHNEFKVDFDALVSRLDINVYKISDGGGEDPTPAASYLTAKASFETWSGLTLPTVNDLEADFYDDGDRCRFYTGVGATSEQLSVFVTHFNSTLSSWEHFGPTVINSNTTRHTYTSANSDEIVIDFYDYGGGDTYFVVTYIPHVATQPEVPCFWYNDGSGWKGESLVQDLSNDDQFCLEHFAITANTQFVLGVYDSDWRYFENLNTTYSNGAEYVIEGDETEEGSGVHNFKVIETGTYNIYVKKDADAVEGKGVYFNVDLYAGYPLATIEGDMTGITDDCIDFVAPLGEYQYYGLEMGLDWGTLIITNKSSEKATALCADFESRLLTLGYHWKYEPTEFNNILVSPNRQVGIALAHLGNNVMVGILNLTLPENAGWNFYANYTFTTSNVGWADADAEFYAWIWGPSESGRWIQLNVAKDEFDNPIHLYIDELPEDITGMKILRVNPDAEYEDKPEVDSNVYPSSFKEGVVWNETGDINLTGYNSNIEFSFEGWVNP